MAKTKISEWSTTPASNTDIDGINIAEGCAPSGINDAIRDLMAQVRSWQSGASGDPFNGPMNGTIGATTAYSGAFTTVSATGVITSTLATGTAPLTIASTTKVANLNADLLDGADWASPAALGSTTPAAVSATTLSASGTVSGTGFSNYLASPPAIGGTAAAAGSFTTLTTSSTVTLNGGTANGVTYLNGSKVLTSGSALTFDGTTLATVSAGINTQNSTSDTVNPITASTNQIRMGASGFVSFRLGTAYDFNIDTYNSASPINVYKVTQAGAHTWSVGGTRTMDLTSTGLGIGTSSITEKLNVVNSGSYAAVRVSNGTNSSLFGYANADGNYNTGAKAGDAIIRGAVGVSIESNNGTSGMRLDSAGNLGLGVAPSAWAGFTALQVKNSALWSDGNTAFLSANTYYNSGYKYIASAAASQYLQASGAHSWYTAASGTAGNAISFTQAMTLDASGQLGIGSTSPTQVLTIAQGGNFPFIHWNNSSNTNIAFAGWHGGTGGDDDFRIGTTGAKAFTFRTNNTERARIDSSGNFYVGATALSSDANYFAYSPGNTFSDFGHSTGVASTTPYTRFLYAGSSIGSITQSGTTGVLYNITSDYRLKTVIGAVTGHGERIDALEPIEYEWKSDGSRTRGFLAHKFQEVYANSVSGEKDAVDADGNPVYQTMQASTSEVIADLVAEIQSLRQRLSAANL